MSKHNELIIIGPAIYTEEAVLSDKMLIIRDGKIHDIVSITEEKKFPHAEFMRFPKHYHLAPGFIDMHVHGANNADVMDAHPEALQKICDTLLLEGTTSYLATTMTASGEQIEKVLSSVSEFKNTAGAEIVGIHLEGPFLSPQKTGAQRKEFLCAPDLELFKKWQALAKNKIKLVTLAPEYPNSSEFIQYLKQNNIIASLGHTHATYAESKAAIQAGCTHATHLFNAMSGMHQREPGAVTAALLADTVMAELIVDGIHLHPAIVQLAFKIKGKNNIVLVTDAMRAKCMQDGCYDLGGQTVTVNNAMPLLADGTLAGSVLKMSDALKNMMAFTACDLQTALHMTSINPAKALGIFAQKGSIAKNKIADLVVLDEKLNVVTALCKGVC
ncbi:hypothetical protein AYO45_02325 [Gammaproteobacteria bacterium SCGC AG-212-F23]|nr:hypothetical protein AYO45_02325 [Gammaproteobacteria bacterium SCGC AG-212-F23]